LGFYAPCVYNQYEEAKRIGAEAPIYVYGSVAFFRTRDDPPMTPGR
jgi:hypothetical protein